MRARGIIACSVLLLSGILPVCKGFPIKQTKEFRYDVSVQLGDESIALSSTYTCVLDGSMLSERGPTWQIYRDTEGRIAALGRSKNGIELQAQPKGIMRPNDYCDAFNDGGVTRTVDSVLYFRQQRASSYHSVESGETKRSDLGEVKISATVTRLKSGHALGLPKPPSAAVVRYYYAISATSRSVDETIKAYQAIYPYPDRGLQPYLMSQRRAWTSEAMIPFDAAAREELGPHV